MKKLLYLLPLVVLIGGVAFWLNSRSAPTISADASLIPLLSEEALAGFTRATEPNNVEFPRDLGAHPDFQTEWWYYTGNLATENGREFGYQFTIFRRALTPLDDGAMIGGETAVSENDWRTNQIYLAHFTISDITSGNFYPHERFSRGAAGLAGAEATPYRVWLEDWSAEEVRPGVVRIFAQGNDVTLDIELSQTLPPVLHGNAGLSQKGAELGNASYYYSFVQQATEGTVQIQDESFTVTGKSWKDHEYSTEALSPGSIGWDWFSLQFDNGTSLMFVQIRKDDGSIEPFSNGSFIDEAGNVTALGPEDWTLTVTDQWRSPITAADYPAGWTVSIPKLGIDLTGEPLMPNQELIFSTIYWEGAIAFSGTIGDSAVSARGYVEMTGYAGSMEGRL